MNHRTSYLIAQAIKWGFWAALIFAAVYVVSGALEMAAHVQQATAQAQAQVMP